MLSRFHQLVVPEVATGQRIDKYISIALPELSRSRVQALIESGHVKRNDKTCDDASAKVKVGESVEVVIPPPEPSVIAPEEIPLDVVYEDADLLVINKPPGLTVHPAPGNRQGTLVNALLAHCKGSLSGIGGVERPGIVHRLDKDTSGLLVVAKNDAAHASLSKQLAERTLKRTYLAVAWGVPKKKSGTIEGNIGRSSRDRKKMAVVKSGGKEATTHYTVKKIFGDAASLIECRLETGRTHQIRVHLAYLGHPLLGDPAYGKRASGRAQSGASRNKGSSVDKIIKSLNDKDKSYISSFPRQALHAFQLQLVHPKTSKLLSFEAPIPLDIEKLIEILGPLVRS